jgi:cytochrome c-type biogenesis protein CcmH/NrfG
MIFGLPLAPVRGVVKLGEVLRDEVDRELHDPVLIRRRLEEIEQARADGLISAEQEAEAVEQVLRRMTGR